MVSGFGGDSWELLRQILHLHQREAGLLVEGNGQGLPLPGDLQVHVLIQGVLYHHPEPSKLLDNLFQSLAPGGELFMETLYFESASQNFEGVRRYAKMKNIYLIPTPSDLKELLKMKTEQLLGKQ